MAWVVARAPRRRPHRPGHGPRRRNMDRPTEDLIRRAAEAIAAADALLIGAGAGMGVDSGLPDFRGSEGFWRAYPPYARLGLGLRRAGRPPLVPRRPGPGLGLLRPSPGPLPPHPAARGFAHPPPLGRSHAPGLVRLHVQRRRPVPARRLRPRPDRRGPRGHRPDAVHGRLRHRGLPGRPVRRRGRPRRRCGPRAAAGVSGCGALARPNILMFGDGDWDASRADAQRSRLKAWLTTLRGAGSWWSSAGPARRSRRSAWCARTSPGSSTAPWSGSTREPAVPAGTSRCPWGHSRPSAASTAGSSRPSTRTMRRRSPPDPPGTPRADRRRGPGSAACAGPRVAGRSGSGTLAHRPTLDGSVHQEVAMDGA